MKATKLVIGVSLLIALAAAAAPTAAAGEATECVDDNLFPDEGEPTPGSIPTCESTHFENCANPDDPLIVVDQLICFVTA